MVAGTGIDEALIGSRVAGFPLEEMSTSAIVLDPTRALVARGVGRSGVLAALEVAWDDEGDIQEEGERLERYAGLVAAALEHAVVRAELAGDLQEEAEALALAMEARAGYTVPREVETDLAARICGVLGVPPVVAVEVGIASRLHDIGMVGVPSAILSASGPLRAEDRDLLRCHPLWSAETLAHVPGLEAVAVVVLHHHEHWDGSGYPVGLANAQIPLASRIVGVSECYRALVSCRPWRDRLTENDALGQIRAEAGAHFDPAVVEAAGEALRI